MSRITSEKRIVSFIHGHGRGWVFTPSSLASLDDSGSIRMALTRLTRQGTIRRIARGLYDYPALDPKLGILSPRADDIARALAGRDAVRIQPAGANAANILGLTEQVPVRIVYLTDGRSREVRVGRMQVVLKKTTPRQMATAGRISGTVIQALRWLGQRNVDDTTIARLRRRLSETERKQLLKDLRYAPTWVAKAMRRMSQPESA